MRSTRRPVRRLDTYWTRRAPKMLRSVSPANAKSPAAAGLSMATGATGLEPATSGVTGRRSNQLSYAPVRGGWSVAAGTQLRTPRAVANRGRVDSPRGVCRTPRGGPGSPGPPLARPRRAARRIERRMAAKRSAGILLHRTRDNAREVLLVHPGGPFWARKDAGAWSIPKGEYEDGEDARACAMREFGEEIGSPAPEGDLVELGEVRQKSGKVVTAWALEGDADADDITSNTFALEWPPRSGKTQEFPEIDRAQWFSLDEARERILPAQAPLLDRLVEQT